MAEIEMHIKKPSPHVHVEKNIFIYMLFPNNSHKMKCHVNPVNTFWAILLAKRATVACNASVSPSATFIADSTFFCYI